MYPNDSLQILQSNGRVSICSFIRVSERLSSRESSRELEDSFNESPDVACTAGAGAGAWATAAGTDGWLPVKNLNTLWNNFILVNLNIRLYIRNLSIASQPSMANLATL